MHDIIVNRLHFGLKGAISHLAFERKSHAARATLRTHCGASKQCSQLVAEPQSGIFTAAARRSSFGVGLWNIADDGSARPCFRFCIEPTTSA